MKTLNQQHLRAASNLNSAITGVNVNLGTAIQSQQQQRPRSVPTMATSPISAKQLTARGIITTQRNIVAASPNAPQMKITTPMTSTHTFISYSMIVNQNNFLDHSRATLRTQKEKKLKNNGLTAIVFRSFSPENSVIKSNGYEYDWRHQ